MEDDETTKRKAIQGASYLSTFRIIKLGVEVVKSALMLRYFGPANMGILAIANSTLGIFGILNFNTPPAIQTFIPQFEGKNDNYSIKNLIYLNYLITGFFLILVAIILILLSETISVFYNVPELAILLKLVAVKSFIILLGGPINDAVFLGLRRYRQLFFSSILDLIGNVIVVVLAIGMKLDLIQFCALSIFSGLAAYSYRWYCYFTIRKALDFGNQKGDVSRWSLFTRVIKFSIPGSINQIFYRVYMYLGNIICGKWLGEEVTGYFSFSLTMINRINDLLKVVAVVLLPVFSQAKIKGHELLVNFFQKGLEVIVFLSVIGSVGIVLFAKELTLFMGGWGYLPAVVLLQVIGFQPLFRTPIHPVNVLFFSIEKPGLNLGFNVLKMIVELTAYITLIPLFKGIGISFSVVISYFFAHLAISYKAFKFLYAKDYLESYKKHIAGVLKATLLIFLCLAISRLLPFTLIISFIVKVGLFLMGALFILKRKNLLKKERLLALKKSLLT